MNRTGLIIMVIMGSGLFSFYPLQNPVPADSLSTLKLELSYRALHPGEVVKVALAHPHLRQAHIRFQEKKIAMAPGPVPGTQVAFLGLDLGIKPGHHLVQVGALFKDGTLHPLTREILVVSKEFPVRKLWVDQKYVTPPGEALERIRVEAQLMASVFAADTREWLGEGNFVVPTEGKIVPNFGERRYFNDQPRSPHTGIDISAPQGTPVIAANSGRVVLARELYYAGNSVIIDHGLGVLSFYGHFSRVKVSRGDVIRKGEIIGEVGATGRVTGPHLHWSVKVRGNRVDPFSLLHLILD